MITTEQLENDLTKNISWTKKSKLWISFLIVGLFVCLVFYVRQLYYGLGETGLRDYVSWGLYISNFVFFVAVSLVGMLVSSVLGLLKIKWAITIGRIAEIVALPFAMVAGLIIITDMGRPDRLLNVFIHGRFQSPIVWDVVVVTTYVTMSFLLIYIPLIPDLALCEKKLSGLPAIQKKIYKLLSLGWAGTQEQYAIIKKVLRLVLIGIIPVALAIHTVTSWLFAMTLRDGWVSSILGPYFVAGAFVAGVAAVIMAMVIFRSNYNLHSYIEDTHFDKMGKLLFLMSLIYLYFNLNEMIVPAFRSASASNQHALHLLSGHDAPLFWMIQIFGFILPSVLLLFPKLRKPAPLFVISLALVIGAWFKRYLIVVPTQAVPNLPIQNVPANYMHYTPTITEIAVTLMPFFLVLIIITILAKTVPLIPIWEYKEILSEKK